MKLPFVEVLKKWKARPSAAPVAAAPVARIEKPASERFGKTVTPNLSRGVSPASSEPMPAPATTTAPQTVSLGGNGDQVRDPVKTPLAPPFSKVTIEDSERFGPSPEAPTKIQPPAPIRLSLPKLPNDSAETAPSSVAPIRVDQPATRLPIALKIPPNGTGAPASERVPASGGLPVPTLSSAPLAAPALPKISLKPAAPAARVAGQELPLAVPETANAEARIRLPLRAVLRGIPPFQLDGPIDEVPAAAQIELPFSIVAPQLSLGRIAISPAQFQAAMPEEYRRFFKYDEGGMPIALPLPEVLQNLPNESLQLRADQVETVLAESFDTPFSQKAAEDAARLKVRADPIAKTAPVPTAPRTALQAALETDDALDAKSVVAHASRLPGVRACAIVSADGLSLAGNIPADYEADALCAIAPSIVRRINEQMIGARFGSLEGVTLFCAKTPVSFFAHGNICLAALHSAGEIAVEIRARLGCIVQELAQMYGQPA